jgi:putative flavoprotein involved in K+ transport
VLERGRVADTWRHRWESFCLVIPNWTIRLAGGAYDGPDPDGFMPRDGVVRLIERYAAAFSAPVREGVEVASLEAADAGGFRLRTTGGDMRAREVVIASGGYQKPHRPGSLAELPESLALLDVSGYSSPAALPDGKVLVIGSGQTGCQVAEELAEAGRDVYLACGRCP